MLKIDWFKNLFVEKKQEDVGPSEIEIKTNEIKARIAEFNRNYPWSKQPQFESLTPKENPKVNAVSEADILKAKLLGKKL